MIFIYIYNFYNHRCDLDMAFQKWCIINLNSGSFCGKIMENDVPNHLGIWLCPAALMENMAEHDDKPEELGEKSWII